MLDFALILLAWSATAFAAPTERQAPAGAWSSVGCVVDGSARALDLGPLSPGSMTPAKCQSLCVGYQYAGVQWGSQCFCGNTLTDGLGTPAPDSECNSPCQGGGSATCGGFYRMNLYKFSSDGCSTGSGSGGFTPCSPSIASSTREKRVWAHHVVGNTQYYNAPTWSSDINQAKNAQVDGFFLSVGTDAWHSTQVASAYSAAQAASFKMAISFDMSVIGCGNASAAIMDSYLSTYVSNSAAAKYNGKSIVTTTGGEICGDSFWNGVLAPYRSNIYWIPGFNTDPTQLNTYSIDGAVGFNTAWPTSGGDINTSRDLAYLAGLPNKGYMPTISPVYYSHLASRNQLRRSDNWLFSMRYEGLLGLRDRIDHVLIVSWNDYAQSTYIGDRIGTIAPGVDKYAKYTHTDVQSLSKYYGDAWKNGVWTAITDDRAWIMSRPHAAYASATSDPLPPPNGRSYTWDNFYVQVHLVAPANVTLCSGSCSTRAGVAGINRFSQPHQVGQSPSLEVNRNGEMLFGLNLLFTFENVVDTYNFNYVIASSSHN